MLFRLFVGFCASAILVSGWAADFSKPSGLAAGYRKTSSAPPKASRSSEEWIYLDNGQVRLGLKLSAAGAIGYFSASGSKENLLNHDHHGRLVQPSFFGNKDGSLWDKKPWCWNAVQAGDWRGRPAKTLEMRFKRTSAYIKSTPKHWATGDDLHDLIFEQWISLTGRLVHAHVKMTYSGHTAHVESDQQIPAISVNPHYDILAYYGGPSPWSNASLTRFVPGRSSESRVVSEPWAAYVNEKDYGVGAYVPGVSALTCCRMLEGGKRGCSFFALQARFAIVPGAVYEFDYYMALGLSHEIREAFKKLHPTSQSRGEGSKAGE